MTAQRHDTIPIELEFCRMQISLQAREAFSPLVGFWSQSDELQLRFCIWISQRLYTKNVHTNVQRAVALNSMVE